MRSGTPTARAALAYARLGWRILPCEPGGKRPILADWPNRATAKPELIRRWFERWPDANLAVSAGSGSGLLVIDVDGPEAERGLVDLERQHGPLPDLCPQQWTGGGRGGWQMFFAWPEGRAIGNSAGRLGPKLDTRGQGGFVLIPPSITVEPYRWAPGRDPWAVPPEPPPRWLVDLLDQPAAPSPKPRAAFSTVAYRTAGEDRYALKALRSQIALVAVAPEGSRNDQLFASAHCLFRLVEGRRLDRDIVERALIDAALHAGLPEGEAARTIASAASRRGL